MTAIRVFDYIEQLNSFVVSKDFKQISNQLGLTEWNEVVWIGRYFTLDNDFGEHWFDNWDLREQIEQKAKELGFQIEELLIVNPERFEDGKDGPCHSPGLRKRFWTDVLKSLHLSLETIVEEARQNNLRGKELGEDFFLPDLEERIQSVLEKFGG